MNLGQYLAQQLLEAEEQPQPSIETPPSASEAPVQESSPNQDENDDYYDYVEANRDKIEKTAQTFNYPIEDMLFAFNGGTPTIMSDDMWSTLENSESYRIKDLEAAIAHALKLGINPRPYIDQIKKKKEMPLPLVLQYNPGKYYLVGGEVVLSILKALGAIPHILVGNITPKKQTLPEPIFEGLDKKNTIKEFIAFAVKKLKINKLPQGLTLSHNTDDAKERRSFGTFDPNNNKIWLYVKNRNMADILRTLAHELVHRKQEEDGKIDFNSGNTGSEIENEANAMAGVLLREFGKTNKNIYENVEGKKKPYVIYCDMDGVLVDFEKGYEELTGKLTERTFNTSEEFWEPIIKAGAAFWIKLEWMPNGKQLWDYIKPYNPDLLSAPSREESSKIGKRVWVKRNMPGTKLILRSAERKQEFATPNSILIDDRADNIQRWKDAGGIGIVHTSAADTIQQLKDLGL